MRVKHEEEIQLREFRHLIGGALVGSEATFGVINPATEEVFAYAPYASREQLDEAVKAASKAFTSWRETSREERKRCVLAMAATVAQHKDELVDLLIREQGKPQSNASLEVDYTSYFAVTTANLELVDEIIRDEERMRVEACYHPVGIVGAIAPWNYPLLLGYWKVFAALTPGNCVILKPSPYTPLTTLRAAELFNEILPPGVLNVLSGGDNLGQWIVQHPGIQKISFTGSSETGKKIVASAAGNLKRVTLELGGNDAAIVLPDADPREIAEKIFWTAFNNSGQICMAIKRLYVHDAIYDGMCDQLVKVAESVRVGEGHESGVQLGPVQNKMQFDKVCEILEDTKRAGGRILTGGEHRNERGYFVPVTLVADAREGMRIVDEEPFGPILPIIRYTNVDEAIQSANRSEYGLGGSIWTKNVSRGTELAKQLQCGTAWVNQHSAVLPDIPFGGHKSSGLGLEGAVDGLKNFCNLQIVNVAK